MASPEWLAPSLSLFATIVSLWAKRSVDTLRNQRRVRILFPQLAAYRKLWALTLPASPSRMNAPEMRERLQLQSVLRDWYYEDGNGIFLSKEARALLVDAKDKLSDDNIAFAVIVRKLSDLRGQLKNDIGVYGKEDLKQDSGELSDARI